MNDNNTESSFSIILSNEIVNTIMTEIIINYYKYTTCFSKKEFSIQLFENTIFVKE